MTAARRVSSAVDDARRRGGCGGVGTSASTPPRSYSRSQFWIVVAEIRNAADASTTDAPCSVIVLMTFSRTSNGYATPRPPWLVSDVPYVILFRFFFATVVPPRLRQPIQGNGANQSRSADLGHHVVRGTTFRRSESSATSPSRASTAR